MSLNSNKICPDCNSQDVQEIVETQEVIINKRNWKGGVLIVACGLLLTMLIILINEGNSSGAEGLIFMLSIIVGVFIILKGNVKHANEESFRHYVCRSCGREFK